MFVFLYLATYMVGVLILCAYGYSLSDSLFEFASAIGTVGLSVGVTSPGMPDVALWAETLAMFLGRLEFIVMIVSFFKVIEDGGRMDKATLRKRCMMQKENISKDRDTKTGSFATLLCDCSAKQG